MLPPVTASMVRSREVSKVRSDSVAALSRSAAPRLVWLYLFLSFDPRPERPERAVDGGEGQVRGWGDAGAIFFYPFGLRRLPH